MKKRNMLLLLAALLLIFSCDTYEKLESKKKAAKTEEKQKAIARIQKSWKKIEINDKVALKGADLVLKAKNNASTVSRIIVLGIKEGEKSAEFIQLANYAANAKLELVDFYGLAQLLNHLELDKEVLKLAKKLSQAKDSEEVNKIRMEMLSLGSK